MEYLKQQSNQKIQESDETQITRAVIQPSSMYNLDNINQSIKLRMEGMKLIVKNQTNINLLDLLRSPLIPMKRTLTKSKTNTKTNQATQKFALQINEAIQINQGVKPSQQFIIRQNKKFEQYISTNLIDRLKTVDTTDRKQIGAHLETKLNIYDSFLTQNKRDSVYRQEDSQLFTSNQEDLQREINISKLPEIDEDLNTLQKSSSQDQNSIDKSHVTIISNDAKKKEYLIPNINQSQTLNASSIEPSPKQIQVTSVVTTSTLEKSVNDEGNQKINGYTMNGFLGQGAFGKVKLAHNMKGEQFAVKIANKSKLKRKMFSMKSSAYTLLDKEIAIMKKINHPNVVQLNEVIDDPKQDKLYLIMEFMAFGSILSKNFFKSMESTQKMILEELKQQEREKNSLSSEESCCFFRQFILGLDYLHNYVGVIHRDIKPENLLVSGEQVLKIADFGVSHIMENEDATISNQQGTQAFLSPEAWGGSNFDGKAVDIWAGGVTLYQFIYGRLPFPSKQAIQLRIQILTLHPNFPEQQGYPPEAIQFLKTLLEKNPEKRANMKQIMLDPWLTKNGTIPLTNVSHQYEEITEVEIKTAITKLSMKMAIKTAIILQGKARKSRQSISNRASLQAL